VPETLKLNDWTLHTFPFAYLSINLWSTDGNPHPVQVYSDVTGRKFSIRPLLSSFFNPHVEFLSSRNVDITWNTNQTSNLVYHQAQQSAGQPFTENNDMSEDGTQYFAFSAVN
jgi:hypothetical protein